MKHERFAERAGRRLEAVADRLECEAKGFPIDSGAHETAAQEMRVAALLVREEAAAVAREEQVLPTQMTAENLSLEAQG